LNNKSYKLLLILCVAGLLLAGVAATVLLTGKDTRPENKAAPDLSLTLLDGSNFQLSDYKGRPVMINFFASWCLPCREEIPALIKIHNTYRKKGVTFVAIAIDDSRKEVNKLIAKTGFNFPIGLDETGKIKEAFGVYGLPTSFFIRKDSTISYSHPGGVNEALLRHELDKIL